MEHSEERVRKGAEKLMKHLNARQQGRLDGFFSIKPKEDMAPSKGKAKGKEDAKGTKRKVSQIPLRRITSDTWLGGRQERSNEQESEEVRNQSVESVCHVVFSL
jgi:hypothetical protein